jgi:hypothetical protein
MKTLRFLGACVKWAVVALVALEILSFLVITGSNYVLYGNLREGSRVVYDPYTFFVMPDGPRPTAYNAQESEGTNHRVIWMFGGSTTRGSTDYDDRTIPSYLARILNGAGGPISFNVVNYGVDSFNSLLETKFFQKELIENPRPPDLVIFYDGANDSTYFSQYRTPYGHLGYRRLRALVEGYHRSFYGLFKPLNAAVLSSFTKELYDKTLATLDPLEPDSELVRQNVALTLQRYRHVRKVARCYGADFLLVWQPCLWVETCRVAPQVKQLEDKETIMGPTFATMRHNIAVTYQALQGLLLQEPYFVDLQNVLCPRTQPVYQPDGVHLRDQGRLMVAQALSRVIQERLNQGGPGQPPQNLPLPNNRQ